MLDCLGERREGHVERVERGRVAGPGGGGDVLAGQRPSNGRAEGGVPRVIPGEPVGAGLDPPAGGVGFEDVAYRAFLRSSEGHIDEKLLQEAGALVPEQRYAWLRDHGLLDLYFVMLETESEKLGRVIRERIHAINPNFIFGAYQAGLPYSWFYRGLIRGLSTPEMPMLWLAFQGLSARELDLRRDVGAAYASLSSSRARAERFRDELIPARETVFAQMQLEHNYMLIGVFELLSARQQSFEAYTGYLEALRDYWVAHAQLARAVGRRLPDAAAPTPEPASEAPPSATETAPTHSHDHGATQP